MPEAEHGRFWDDPRSISQLLKDHGFAHKKSANVNSQDHDIFRADTGEQVACLSALGAVKFLDEMFPA